MNKKVSESNLLSLGAGKTPETWVNTNGKQYEKPILICYGDVRDVTLGPTFGGGESGCEGIFRVGPGGCPTP